MVNVFPDPVCPYAKMQTLKPSNTERMRGFVSANTCSGKHTRSSMCEDTTILTVHTHPSCVEQSNFWKKRDFFSRKMKSSPTLPIQLPLSLPLSSAYIAHEWLGMHIFAHARVPTHPPLEIGLPPPLSFSTHVGVSMVVGWVGWVGWGGESDLVWLRE